MVMIDPVASLRSGYRTLNTLAITLSYYRKAIQAIDPQGAFDPLVRDELMMAWANRVLGNLNVEIALQGKVMKGPGLLVGNHLSYLDIPLLMTQAPVMFLAKSEVGRWPLIGSAIRLLRVPLVDRKNSDSRKQSAAIVKDRIAEGEKVCIFPSGTTCLYESKPWRYGALQLAYDIDAVVQPFSISYHPLRLAAFIDEDYFVPHLRKLTTAPKIKATLRLGRPFKVRDVVKQTQRLQVWSRPADLSPSQGEAT